MPVNTRSSNADKHPGQVDLSDDEGSDSSKRGKAPARKQKKAKKAEEDAKEAEKAEAKLALAKLAIQVEDEMEEDYAAFPRRRKSQFLIVQLPMFLLIHSQARRSEPNTDGEPEQPPKKKQKETKDGDMDVDFHLPKDGSDGSCESTMAVGH
jgi:hypothetical protein